MTVERSPADRFKNLLSIFEGGVPDSVDSYMYRRKQMRLGAVLTTLAEHARVSAIYGFFVERNLDKFKQNCYLASRLALASIGQDGGASFCVGGELLYGMLSDNEKVIAAIAVAETEELIRQRNGPTLTAFHVHMIQLALRGDDGALLSKIEKVAKNGRKPDRADSAAGKDFFSLLLKREQAGLENFIQTRSARIKSSDVAEEDFFSYLGVLQTKLCWIRGIPVQIDSPLVPMALMPVRPLAHYDDVYEFLAPGWVPPPQGVVADILRWLKRQFE